MHVNLVIASTMNINQQQINQPNAESYRINEHDDEQIEAEKAQI